MSEKISTEEGMIDSSEKTEQSEYVRQLEYILDHIKKGKK